MIREYGSRPFNVAVIHGGPGAPGYMAPVARELASERGVIEPLQSARTVRDQINELISELEQNGDRPMTLIGSSWGAMLALFCAAERKAPVDKVIMVGSGVFDANSSERVSERRLDRLDDQDRRKYHHLQESMESDSNPEDPYLRRAFGKLLEQSDHYAPLTTDLEVLAIQLDVFQAVWSDYVDIRDNGDSLRETVGRVEVPVTVIHGDHDPHPIDGIVPFLQSCLTLSEVYVLERCGHYPWIERFARDRFFEILRKEILSSEDS